MLSISGICVSGMIDDKMDRLHVCICWVLTAHVFLGMGATMLVGITSMGVYYVSEIKVSGCLVLTTVNVVYSNNLLRPRRRLQARLDEKGPKNP